MNCAMADAAARSGPKRRARSRVTLYPARSAAVSSAADASVDRSSVRATLNLAVVEQAVDGRGRLPLDGERPANDLLQTPGRKRRISTTPAALSLCAAKNIATGNTPDPQSSALSAMASRPRRRARSRSVS